MRGYFFDVYQQLEQGLHGSEILCASLSAECSDFVRLNHARVRQAGQVQQASMSLRLVQGRRHALAECNLSGDLQGDLDQLRALLAGLRERLPLLPEDPHLLIPTQPASSDSRGDDQLPPAAQALASVLAAAEGLDLVGLYAQGAVQQGFAGSTGQRHWYESHSFALDYCLYHQADKAVKSTYAGFAWSEAELHARMQAARERLAVLARPAKVIKPGGYRAYLAPAALSEVLGLLAWEAFGLRNQRTGSSPLLRLVLGQERLHAGVNLSENVAGGLAPRFSDEGFARPDRVPLVSAGRHAGALVSPRSAQEYGQPTNGASQPEIPSSLELAGGELRTEQLLEQLGEGIWVSDLWYTNFSHRVSCRITGMTRFATCWVEGGQVVAPLAVMRFDESLYRMLGEQLQGLTREQEFLPSTETYFRRSTDSMRLPGALVRDFNLTL